MSICLGRRLTRGLRHRYRHLRARFRPPHTPATLEVVARYSCDCRQHKCYTRVCCSFLATLDACNPQVGSSSRRYAPASRHLQYLHATARVGSFVCKYYGKSAGWRVQRLLSYYNLLNRVKINSEVSNTYRAGCRQQIEPSTSSLADLSSRPCSPKI